MEGFAEPLLNFLRLSGTSRYFLNGEGLACSGGLVKIRLLAVLELTSFNPSGKSGMVGNVGCDDGAVISAKSGERGMRDGDADCDG